MTEIVIVSPWGTPIAQLGEYTVGVRLTDPPGMIRVNGQPVNPYPMALTFDWSELPGYPIELRQDWVNNTIEFRLKEGKA